jgi:hypothetical protein
MSELDSIFKKLRNLKQNKDKSNDEIMALAKEQSDRQEILGKLTFCINDEERDFAKQLLENYLAESSIESFSDKDTLRQLIDIEILIERIKKTLNTEYNKQNPFIPDKLLDQLQELNKQTMALKESLGFSNTNKDKENFIELFNALKKKALKYYEEHAGCTEIRCPHCNEYSVAILRTQNKDIKKHPWFKGTVLYNKPLYEMYHKKEITTEKMAEIFGVSTFDIEYIYETVYLPEIEKNTV